MYQRMGHRACEKVLDALLKSYWFPDMGKKVKEYISNCLQCIAFSSKHGKRDGFLHSIPKGNMPFETIHIDHFGPVPIKNMKKRYVFLVIDGFTKFVKL